MGPRGVRACALCLLTALLVAGSAWSAPRPDPPPIPPPAPTPQPPAPEPPPVAPPAVVAPSGPSAAELAARKRAALRAQRRRAAQVAAAKARAAARARALAPQAKSASAGFSDPESGPAKALPFLLVGVFGGVLLLGMALTPARAVPWRRVSDALDDRRQELALLGALGLVATVMFFLFAMLSSV